MWHFQRIDLLSLVAGARFVSFVGGGGKTSIAEYLAAAALQRGLKAVITTTTKIYVRDPFLLLEREGMQKLTGAPPFVRIGQSLEGGKLTGVDSEAIRRMGQLFDLVLIEADGAKGRPLKYPAPYEPVIPDVEQTIVIVAGLDGLFATVGEALFRQELFGQKSGIGPHEPVTPELFAGLFSDEILLKGVNGHPFISVLNKYDTQVDKGPVRTVACHILRKTGRPVVIASARHGVSYLVRD